MKKKKYYDIKNLLSVDAEYMILLGQRANGKSYQVKKTVLENAYRNKKKFVYLRRFQVDIKMKSVESYFSDMPIISITDGEYDSVIAWQGFLYFANVDNENGNTIRGEEIGRYCDLNDAIRYKSQTFINYSYIIYEEFITDSLYLADEPTTLQQFVSTVARHERIQVFLIGNTISRVCPYFSEWCLEGVLNQKIGTIELYHYTANNENITIAVEYCQNANYKNKMFFGQSAKQIVSGEWETKDVPKLPKKFDEYELIYEIKVVYQKKFTFIMSLLLDDEEESFCVFIYPYTGHKEYKRIITDEFTISNFISNQLNPSKFFAESIIQECFRYGKVCYSDNLTGSDFKQVAKQFNFIS